ncbi:glycoside hydrolase family 30 protein [Flavitalea sp. BT771]|uniref:glycoside hydrolase family 30 protein n=1 Tax=Flavitalea sp. BT771 TaxID=3063329 RepID=UPI0026E238B1|nr:glycoside hydrolase family 30 protein [Flavitalea sp. BT771]MDO6431744.1 glycoside hydrolase family 30 protein [Flavitalea sp. BT771]MDV6220652.1 glycoside hydrolase family 30 protein [Flavitalea sp. BT771]
MNKILAIFLVLAGGGAYAQSGSIYTTAEKSPLRLAQGGKLNFTDSRQPLETEPFILVDPQSAFQTIIGIGGALTDASAETFSKIPKAQQSALLRAYYDPQNGIGYTLARTQIQSCDFSSGSYSYIKDNDTALTSFSVAHDEQYRIPLIRQAIAAAGGSLPLFVSPWSPPGWMKDNGSVIGGGHLKAEYARSWANFYIKFIRAYEEKGIPIWGLTVQNEPMAKQKWESCIYTAAEERDFIKNYLGPILQSSGMSNKKLIAWDHNRDLLYQRASTILEDPGAAKYIWGIGYHWYETWTGGPMQFENMKLVTKAFPDAHLIFTEGCQEKFNFDSLKSWSLGEKYGYSMVNDFNNGCVGWTDWNILLDEKGGPNHVGNFCFAPVHADTRTGNLIYTNAYYYIGHFSKFVRPGAKRIAASTNRAQLQTTAFLNTDGSIAVVVLNTTGEQLPYRLILKGKETAAESLPHSISTLIIQ